MVTALSRRWKAARRANSSSADTPIKQQPPSKQNASEARKRDGRLVLVSGKSGMGKTALLEAFERKLAGARWLWGACDGLLTPRPLGPLFDIGAQLGGEQGAACRNVTSRDRLFASFLAEIDSPANFTVVVIEDVHWEAGWPSVPATVRDAVGARLARASASARRRGRGHRHPPAGTRLESDQPPPQRPSDQCPRMTQFGSRHKTDLLSSRRRLPASRTCSSRSRTGAGCERGHGRMGWGYLRW